MNRHIPFGYTIQNGEMVTNENELPMVKKIFEMYLGGSSYRQIAVYMESIGVNYRQDSDKWNKNMVKRILENSRYIGNDSYPAIVTADIFRQVTDVIAKKGGVQGKPKPPDTLKNKVYCGICDGAFYRRDKGKSSRPKWICRKCESVRLIYDALESAILGKMNALISNPPPICKEQANTEPSLETKRLTNEINRGFDQRALDKERMKDLIFALADERYQQSDDGDAQRQTQILRELFMQVNPITELDDGLFEKTVRRLYIDQYGEVTLELANGQKI